MKKKLSVLNLVSVILVILVNYISQAFSLNDTTIGEMSAKYANLFTPAGYAFAIWGVIFLSLLAYGIFQVKRAFFSDKPSDFIEQTGYWFVLANVLNCCWVIAFMYNYTGLSVIIMLGILLSLIKIILNTNMERWDAPIEVLAFVWWPICFYSGWISVATIANISAYLSKLDWNGGILSEQAWTINMIVAAIIINLLMIWKRNMREFALVGVWALAAIFVRHNGSNIYIAYSAMAGAIILFITIAAHGIKNHKTSPFKKLQERLQEKS
ncbi:tryptophan-rich sensory protein [Maribacter sp. R86514]|uniref:tryptophan-rich sensory protein n=1 Tax=Maribacter sp. R86514 TaxID=3093854 RepID=UPI0037C78C14